jgi:hypothetical protein
MPTTTARKIGSMDGISIPKMTVEPSVIRTRWAHLCGIILEPRPV